MGKAFGYRRWFLVLAVAACGGQNGIISTADNLLYWNMPDAYVPVIVFGYAVVLAILIGGGTIITLELVFGRNAFVVRLGEYTAWVSVAITFAFACYLSLGGMPPGEDLRSFFFLTPVACVASQLPFWILAYIRNWHFQRVVGDNEERKSWSLRDWMIGSIVLGLPLALVRQLMMTSGSRDGRTDEVIVFTAMATLIGIFISLPISWYVLRTTSSRLWKIGVLVHIAILVLLVGVFFAAFGFSRNSEFFIMWLIYSVLLALLVLGAVGGAWMFRLDGYRLVAGKKPSGQRQASDVPQGMAE